MRQRSIRTKKTAMDMENIKYLWKAAEILSDLDMGSHEYLEEGIYYCAADIYLKDLTAGRVFADTSIPIDDKVDSWAQSGWVDYIVSKAQRFLEETNFTPDMVASVVVEFKLRPTSGSIYRLESTNLAHKDGFDRFFVTKPAGVTAPSHRTHYELYLDPELSAQIHSVCGAVELLKEHQHRFIPVRSDLPWICRFGNSDMVC